MEGQGKGQYKTQGETATSHIPDSHHIIASQVEKYRKYFLSVARENGLALFSIGSGSARIESQCEKEGHRVICVDPEPDSYLGPSESVMIRPLYAAASEVATDRPDVVGNCAVMLVRTDPGDPYDCKALEILRPKIAFVIFCVDGTDGSMQFHAMLHKAGLPSQFKWMNGGDANQYEPENLQYGGSIAYYARETPPPRCFGGPAIALLWSDDFRIVAKLPSGDQNPRPLTDAQITALASRSLQYTIEQIDLIKAARREIGGRFESMSDAEKMATVLFMMSMFSGK